MPTVVLTPTQRGISTVQSTAHWTAVIATSAVSVCLIIAMLALAIVVAHDGNTIEVNNAMSDMVNIGGTLAFVISAVAGGPQIVSALVSTFLPRGWKGFPTAIPDGMGSTPGADGTPTPPTS